MPRRTARRPGCSRINPFIVVRLCDAQTTDGLDLVLSDIELRARVYSGPLLPKTDKSVPQPDKAVWKHLTVRARSEVMTVQHG